mmetsp:Transcript_10890/g.16286  ORF Transcript_10890/g.16286 Transcript_10890/m.16286 type:complete len:201 (+) Transcript_10890:2094-2696(+)
MQQKLTSIRFKNNLHKAPYLLLVLISGGHSPEPTKLLVFPRSNPAFKIRRRCNETRIFNHGRNLDHFICFTSKFDELSSKSTGHATVSTQPHGRTIRFFPGIRHANQRMKLYLTIKRTHTDNATTMRRPLHVVPLFLKARCPQMSSRCVCSFRIITAGNLVSRLHGIQIPQQRSIVFPTGNQHTRIMWTPGTAQYPSFRT